MLWRSDTQPHVYRLRTNYQPVGIVVPLVTGIRHTDHITPVLQSLHWLLVWQRVTFKLATLVHIEVLLLTYLLTYLLTSAWTAEHLAIWPTTSVLPAAVVLAHGQPPVWCWTFLVRRRHWEIDSICRRRTACLEQPSSCHPWSVTVAVNLRKAAENLFVCLRVAALVTYELAPWKCTD